MLELPGRRRVTARVRTRALAWLALTAAATAAVVIDHLGLTLEPLPKGLEPASQIEPRERLATLPTIPSAIEAAEQPQPGKRRSGARTEEGHFLAFPNGGAFTPARALSAKTPSAAAASP